MPDDASGYDETSQQIGYQYASGAFACPVAGPPGTACEVIQLHAPIGGRSVVWRMQRSGAMPKMPSPKPHDNEVLISSVIKPSTPGFQVDGTPVVSVEGSYTYAYFTPRTYQDDMPMGITPIDIVAPNAFVLQAGDFLDTLTGGDPPKPKPVQAVPDISAVAIPVS